MFGRAKRRNASRDLKPGGLATHAGLRRSGSQFFLSSSASITMMPLGPRT